MFRFAAALCLAACLLLSLNGASAQVQIAELLASTSEEDADGVSLEWLELVNRSDRAVSLEGYSLSDDPMAPRKWLLPSVRLLPGEYQLIWTTGLNRIDENAYHANFRLEKNGERVWLYGPGGVLEDQVEFPAQRTNISFGRNSAGDWRFFDPPTPGLANPAGGYAALLSAPEVNPPGGVYAEIQRAEAAAPDGVELCYTLDGSLPTQSDSLWTGSLPVRNDTVLRIRAFRDGYGPSPAATHSYFIRDEQHLPILSMVSDAQHFFNSRTGIIANAQQHGEAWERPCSVEWIGIDGVRLFGADCGVRIHGGASRGRSPKKSFRLYFRSEYGPARLNYAILPETPRDDFDRLVVRGGFNDTWGYDNDSQRPTAIVASDQTARDLHRLMGHEASFGVFVELYINGEPWGIYNPSERINDDFMRYYYGGRDWDIIADGIEAKDGDMAAWNELDDWFVMVQRQGRAGTQEAYEELARMVDIEAFTDYVLINVWLQNYDWPRHNWYASRERLPGSKWLFFLWDVEYSFGSGGQGYRIDQNTFQNATDTNHLPGRLFDYLIGYSDYQDYVWRRLRHHLSNTLSPDSVHAALNRRVDEIRPVIPLESELWGIDKTPADFERAVGLAHQFIDERTPEVLRFARQYLGAEPVRVSDWALY